MAIRFKKIEILISEGEEGFLRSLNEDMRIKHGIVEGFLEDTIDALDNNYQVIVTDVNRKQLRSIKNEKSS